MKLNTKTLCFLLRDVSAPEVLLGLKKIGFGAGKYAGFGGGVEAGETIDAAAVRELAEECAVQVSGADLEPVAQLTFLFPAKPSWDQVVHVFLVTVWQGEPTESAEMQPVWCSVDALPFAKMWADAVYWLPLVLENQKLKARFVYQADNATVAEAQLETWE